MISYFNAQLSYPYSDPITNHTISTLQSAENPASFLNSIPLTLQASILNKQNNNSIYKEVISEQTMVLAKSDFSLFAFKDYPHHQNNIQSFNDTEDVLERKSYFNYVYGNINIPLKKAESFWELLVK